MDNNSKREQQPQHEADLKLSKEGASTEAIGTYLGVAAESFQDVKDLSEIKKLESSIKVPLTRNKGRQMTLPMQLRETSASPNPKLRSAKFSQRRLTKPVVQLKQEDPQEDLLTLAAECLSVLSPEDDQETVFRVFEKVESMQRLTQKLRDLVPKQHLLRLLQVLSGAQPFQDQAITLASELLQDRQDTGVFDEAFNSFIDMIMTTASLSTRAVEVAEEISNRLSCPQLKRLHFALKSAVAPDNEIAERIEQLWIKEARFRLNRGDEGTARDLVTDLSPVMKTQAVELWGRAGRSKDKILEELFISSMEKLSQEHPATAAPLGYLHQLLYAEIKKLTTQYEREALEADKLIKSLRGEINGMKRAQHSMKAPSSAVKGESPEVTAKCQFENILAYNAFAFKRRKVLKSKHPELNGPAISKLLGKEWSKAKAAKKEKGQ
jgi:hypothetical protein